MMIEFNRDRYLRLAKANGYSSALSQLHRDLESWEQQTFEGEDGYRPEMMKELTDVRAFSRELWEMALRDPEGKNLH